jgi:hypothetical protein
MYYTVLYTGRPSLESLNSLHILKLWKKGPREWKSYRMKIGPLRKKTKLMNALDLEMYQ